MIRDDNSYNARRQVIFSTFQGVVLYKNEPTKNRLLCARTKDWRAERASAVGASIFLDFFVLFYYEKRTKKDYLNTQYANNGNILTRTDMGTYGYSLTNAGPHSVTGITDATGTLLSEQNQSVSYTAFNKLSHIGQRGYDYFITYGPDRLRRQTSLHTGIADGVLLTKYYAFGDFEKETDASGTRHLHYIQGGDGLAAVYVKNEKDNFHLKFLIHSNEN